MSEKPSFFSELKRRNVYKVAVAYAVIGWLIAQIATQIFPFLKIPNWIVRLVIVLIAIGFPIALVIATGYAQMGDADHAVPLLDSVLHQTYVDAITPAYLRFDPRYDRIRNDPRFEKLCQEK